MSDARPPADEWSVAVPPDDAEIWIDDPDDEHTLVDLVNHLLDKGVVISGDVTISVAGVDLVYLGLNAVLTSVSTAREHLGRPVGREPLDE